MVNKINKKKSQSFSMDILVVVAILLFGIIFLVANKINSSEDSQETLNALDKKVEEQSNLISNELKKSEVLDSQNNVQIDKLLQLDIQKIKEELNIDNDFCIIFEKDGNLIKIDSENDINGIGSDKIIVNGKNCVSN